MSEIKDILSLYERIATGDSQHAFATVISTEGPSYRSAGARSLIIGDGTFRGGLSAGCLESDIACRLDGNKEPFIVEYDLSTEDDIRGFPFGCGGTVSVFVEPLPNPDALQAVQWLASLEEAAVLVTVVNSKHPRYPCGIRYGESTTSTNRFESASKLHVGDVIEKTFASKKSSLQNIEKDNCAILVFAEYFEPATNIVIYGDGEDAVSLATLAETVGMDVHRITKDDLRTNKFLIETNPVIIRAFNVVMTHDLSLDTEALKQLLPHTPPYIGVMGPRSRTEKILSSIAEDALQTLSHENFYSPVGLNMAAETPNEIALSIVAEIQTVARDREPKHLRDTNGAIHDRAANIAEVRNQVRLRTTRGTDIERVVGA